MPYATAYKIISKQSQTGHVWNAYIEDRELDSDDITELKAGDVMVDIQYYPLGFYADTGHPNIFTSTCTVEFIDDETGVLSELVGADDERYRLRVEGDSSDEWLGFILTDSYKYDLYGKTVSSISATDRIQDLKEIPYSQGGGVLYTGREDLLTILTQCLDSTGLDIGLSTHCNWFPHLGTNELDTDDDPLERLLADQSEFVDADGFPYSKFTVLDQILRRFQLQIMQSEKRWFIQHRRKEISGGNYKVYQYDADATPDGTNATLNHTARVEVATTGANQQIIGRATVSGTKPYGSVASTYYHKTPGAGALGNAGFESAIQTSGGSGVGNWRVGGTTPTPVVASPGISGAGLDVSTQALYMDIIYESTTGFTSIPADPITNLNDYVEQTSSGPIEGAPGRKMQVSIDVTMTPASASVDPAAGRVYFFVEWHVGSYKLHQTSHIGAYQWSTSPPTDEEKLHFERAILPGTVQTLTFTTEEMSVASVDVTGDIYCKIYNATEDKNGGASNTAQVDQVVFDNVSYKILDDDNVELNAATRTLITYDGNTNRSSPETPTQIIGDGPTTGHPTRLTVLDSTDTERDITSDWNWLPAPFISGVSLDQFWANEMLKEFRQTNKEIITTFYTKEGTNPPKPHQYFVLANPNNTAEQDYTWQELSYRPVNHDQILSGTFIEYQRGANGDQICVVDIKPNTALLAGIDVDQGLVCDSTDPFVPPSVPTTLYYSNSSKEIKKATIDRISGSWSATTIRTSSSLTLVDMFVDGAAGYIFTSVAESGDSNRYIKRSDLVGGLPSTLVTITAIDSGFPPTVRICLDKLNRRIIAVITNFTSGDKVSVYSYDGVLIQSASFIRDTTSIGAPAVSEDGTYAVYQTFGGGTKRVQKYDYAGNANTDIETSGASVELGAHAFMDDDYGSVFFEWSGADEIRTWPTPGGGSFSSVITTAGTTELGLAGDRVYQKIYAGTTNNTIKEYNYDGTGERTVIDDSLSGSDIQHIDLDA